jgi:hypothetical protein
LTGEKVKEVNKVSSSTNIQQMQLLRKISMTKNCGMQNSREQYSIACCVISTSSLISLRMKTSIFNFEQYNSSKGSFILEIPQKDLFSYALSGLHQVFRIVMKKGIVLTLDIALKKD